jgi:hypothetical protein
LAANDYAKTSEPLDLRADDAENVLPHCLHNSRVREQSSKAIQNIDRNEMW